MKLTERLDSSIHKGSGLDSDNSQERSDFSCRVGKKENVGRLIPINEKNDCAKIAIRRRIIENVWNRERWSSGMKITFLFLSLRYSGIHGDEAGVCEVPPITGT